MNYYNTYRMGVLGLAIVCAFVFYNYQDAWSVTGAYVWGWVLHGVAYDD